MEALIRMLDGPALFPLYSPVTIRQSNNFRRYMEINGSLAQLLVQV